MTRTLLSHAVTALLGIVAGAAGVVLLCWVRTERRVQT